MTFASNPRCSRRPTLERWSLSADRSSRIWTVTTVSSCSRANLSVAWRLTARALPVVLPVNFALLDGDIVWRSAQGTKLNAASAGFVVAFEVDRYEADRREGWSVMVQGLAHVITDPEELDRPEEAAARVLGARRDRRPLCPTRAQHRDRHADPPRRLAPRGPRELQAP